MYHTIHSSKDSPITSFSKHFYHSKKKLCTITPQTPPLYPPIPRQSLIFFLLVNICLFWTVHIMKSYNMWPLMTGFFRLACFQVQSRCIMYRHFISFYGQIILHCMEYLHKYMFCLAIHQLVDIWVVSPLWLLWIIEHLCTNFWLDICFDFFWVYT